MAFTVELYKTQAGTETLERSQTYDTVDEAVSAYAAAKAVLRVVEPHLNGTATFRLSRYRDTEEEILQEDTLVRTA